MSRKQYPFEPVTAPATGLPVVQNLAVTTTSAVTPNAVGAQTYAVQLSTSVACYVLFTRNNATAATATNGFYLPAGVTPITMGIPPGTFIAALAASGSGTLSVLEIT
jgi:hypothetical protein